MSGAKQIKIVPAGGNLSDMIDAADKEGDPDFLAANLLWKKSDKLLQRETRRATKAEKIERNHFHKMCVAAKAHHHKEWIKFSRGTQ